MRIALIVLLAAISPSAFAQVVDDFSDGDFANNPTWSGDTDRFTVVPFAADFALQSDGLAEADTISLSTSSPGVRGEWRLLFQWNFNLSTSNGVRIYLVANNADLKGTLQGYFLQLGTNNEDEVRLYRQDGTSADRTLLASGTQGTLAGNNGTVTLRVLRDDLGQWQVFVNGAPDITGVTEDSFDISTHLGVWVKHSTTAGQAFLFDDVLQDPTPVDLTPPTLVGAEAIDATTVEVEFDEEVVPETADYSISGGIGTPLSATLVPGFPERVSLALTSPLQDNTSYTLSVSNVADPSGNTLVADEATFFFGSLNVPEPGDIVINEIMYDPPTPQSSSNEWVELLNTSTETFDLVGFTIQDEAGNPVQVTSASTPLNPGDYAVLVNDGAEFAAAFPGVAFMEVAGFPSLNNSGDRPAILFDGDEIDAVPYLPGWGGTDSSLERIDPNGPSNFASNWATTTASLFGTPGAENSVFEPDVTPPSIVSVSASDPNLVDVIFSEPVDPITAGSPANYSIDGGIGQPAVADVAPEGEPERVQLFLSNPLTANSSYTLTVSGIQDIVGNVLASGQSTFFFGEGEAPEPLDLVINEFIYDEPATNNPAEYVELYNRSDKVLDLADFTVGDSSGQTDITTTPVFVMPAEYAVLVEDAASFSAVFPSVPFVKVSGWRSLNNSGDAIVLRHSGLPIDSLFYDDSWGGEDASLERKDPNGPSSFAVNWMTTTDPRGGTPGEQNSVFLPDTEGPLPTDVAVSLDGLSLTVPFDEPLEEASVTVGAFSITGPTSSAVTGAEYSLLPDPVVTLTLGSPLSLGEYVLGVEGVRDLLGNGAQGVAFPFSFEPDETAPSLTTAFALGATTVEVRFSESVTESSAGNPGNYAIDGGIGSPELVVFPLEGDDRRAQLVLSTPLTERVIYTLTVDGVADATGNTVTNGTATLFFGEADVPLSGELAINEIMFDPINGGDGEYVELLNLSDKLFDLRTLVFTDDGDSEGTTASETPAIIPSNGYVVLVANRDSFSVVFPDIQAPIFEARSFPGLNNEGDALTLFLEGVVIDSVYYQPEWHRVELEDAKGISLERVDPQNPATDPTNWSSSLDPRGGTPGAENTAFVVESEAPRSPGLEIDSPFDPDAGQSTAIRYTLNTDTGLIRVRIFDGAGRLVRQLEDGNLSGPTGTLLWDGRGDDGRQLRIGIYIVLLEAVNVEGATNEAHRGVAVLARQF